MSIVDAFGKPIDGQADTTPKTDQAPVHRVSYAHQKVLDQLLAAIASCPMDVELKQILRMRIWGKYPEFFNPMTCVQIALDIKTKGGVRVTAKDVERWEEDAQYNIEQFLGKEGIVEISEKFIRDNDIKKIATNN